MHREYALVFKICPSCDFVWNSREIFLADLSLKLIGYQVNFEELTSGVFLFNHDCGTTLAIGADQFEDFYNDPIFERRLTGDKSCPHYCLNRTVLRPCPEKCECAFVHEILQIVKEWPKAS